MISRTLTPRTSQFSSPMFWLVKTSSRPLCLNIADHHPIPGNRMCLRATKGKRKHTIRLTGHYIGTVLQVKIIIPAHTGEGGCTLMTALLLHCTDHHHLHIAQVSDVHFTVHSETFCSVRYLPHTQSEMCTTHCDGPLWTTLVHCDGKLWTTLVHCDGRPFSG